MNNWFTIDQIDETTYIISEYRHWEETHCYFTISESAVKKQARSLKSVIKLDKNFHIYIHGDRELIEKGEDKKGKFYKVYYQEEN